MCRITRTDAALSTCIYTPSLVGRKSVLHNRRTTEDPLERLLVEYILQRWGMRRFNVHVVGVEV